MRLAIRSEYAKGIRNFPQLLRWQWGLWRWLLANRNEYDFIHACDFDTVLPALWCQFFHGKPVIYDIFDFYADHLRATPELIKKIIRWTDYRAINMVQAVILVDDARRQQISGSRPRKLEIIYNSPQDIWESVQTENRPKNSKLHIAYIGLLQIERGLLEVLELLKNHPEWSLSLAGFGGDAERIERISSGLTNVTNYGRVDYVKALQLSKAADVLFATYDPVIPNHRYSSPNKLFEAMMLSKPIIVAENTNMDRIVQENNCGLVVPYGNLEKLETAFQELENDPDRRAQLGAAARRAYDYHYGWPQMKQRLQQLYQDLENENF
jgi:glycosyltransferase involved in cell wall biosynthesis